MNKLLICFLLFLSFFLVGCSNERTVFGKIIYFNTGTNNVFGYKITHIVISDKDKKVHLTAKKGLVSGLKEGDQVKVTYHRDTIAITMEELEFEGKKFKGVTWKRIISIKKN